MKRINSKVLLSMIFLILLSSSAIVFKKDVMDSIRWLLESGWLRVGLLMYIVVTIIIHSFFIEETYLSDVPLFQSRISKPLYIFLTIGTYAAVTSTAVTLLKGAYIQQFYGDVIYFNEFEKIDIYALLGVATLLLWYAIFNTSRLLKEALFVSVKADETKAA